MVGRRQLVQDPRQLVRDIGLLLLAVVVGTGALVVAVAVIWFAILVDTSL